MMKFLWQRAGIPLRIFALGAIVGISGCAIGVVGSFHDGFRIIQVAMWMCHIGVMAIIIGSGWMVARVNRTDHSGSEDGR